MKASALITLASVFTTSWLAVTGCGDDEKPKEESRGDTVECGGLVCEPVILTDAYPPIEACCTSNDQCGLDGSQFEDYGAVFAEQCQPRNQPGDVDDECPASTPVETDFGPLFFPGCCTPAGRCGYYVERAFMIFELGLGCVDAAPFLDAGTPASCTPGPDGGGGAGGGAGQ